MPRVQEIIVMIQMNTLMLFPFLFLVLSGCVNSAETERSRVAYENLASLISDIELSVKAEKFDAANVQSQTIVRLGSEVIPHIETWLKKDISRETKRLLLKAIERMGVAAKDAIPFLKVIEIFNTDYLGESALRAQMSIGRHIKCGFPDLPDNTKIYYLEKNTGDRILYDIQLNDDGDEVAELKVVVTERDHPVVLILKSERPMIWKIGMLKGVTISGVYVSGDKAQGLIGIPASVPHTVVSPQQMSKSCPLVDSKLSYERKGLDLSISSLTGHNGREEIINASNDMLFAGPVEYNQAEIVSHDEIPLYAYAKPRDIPYDKKGIEHLLEKGILRLATQEDMDSWEAVLGEGSFHLEQLRKAYKETLYIITAPMKFPPGYRDSWRQHFVVLKGVPQPKEKPVLNTILIDLNLPDVKSLYHVDMNY